MVADGNGICGADALDSEITFGETTHFASLVGSSHIVRSCIADYGSCLFHASNLSKIRHSVSLFAA